MAHDQTKLVNARGYVRIYAPYFTPTLFGLVPTPVENLTELVGGPMAVTERLVLLYDPAWVEAKETSELVLATGFGHEILHHQLQHVSRGKFYADKDRWNLAADLFINGSMRDQMKRVKVRPRDPSSPIEERPLWEFPDWAAMPENYDFPKGLSADEYYRLLEKKEKKKPDDSDGAGSGDGKGKGKAGNSKPRIMCGGCGGVSGNHTDAEGPSNLEHKYNETKGRSKSNCDAIARETARAIQAHIESGGGGRGSLPGIWSELVEISDNDFPIPWRAKFASLLRYTFGMARTGGLDYSMRRISKRSYLRGIRLPGLISYDPDIAFIVDSSGSMGKPQLGDALRIGADVLQQAGIQSAWFMEADAGKQRDPIRIRADQLRSIELLGRGGTDFRPALRYMEKEFKPRPQVVIYLTDGDGAWPEEAPDGFFTIRCIVPAAWSQVPDLDWGETIVLDDLLPERKTK